MRKGWLGVGININCVGGMCWEGVWGGDVKRETGRMGTPPTRPRPAHSLNISASRLTNGFLARHFMFNRTPPTLVKHTQPNTTRLTSDAWHGMSGGGAGGN